MSLLQRYVKNISPKYFEYSIVFVLLISMLMHWLRRFSLSPDSTSYLTAAINLVKYGKLFIWVNWPSHNLQPGREIYSAFMPGYPMYLAPFVYLFKNPTNAAMIAQSFIFIGVFFAIYLAAIELEINGFLRILLMIIVLKNPNFEGFWNYLLSEPIFTFFSLCLFLIALSLMKPNSRKLNWALAYLFIFLAASVRWNGFGVGAILLFPIFLSEARNKLFKKLAALLIVTVTPNLLWYCRNSSLLPNGFGMHSFQGIIWEKVSFPFVYTVSAWGGGSVIYTCLLFAFPIAAAFLFKQISFKDKNYVFLIYNILVQFFTIYLISLFVSTISPIDGRFLVVPYLFFTILFFYVVSKITRNLIEKWNKEILLLTTIVFVVALGIKTLLKKVHAPQGEHAWSFLSIPKEQELWRIIKTRPYFTKSNHFLSDFNPVHQIYAGYSQRIIWDSTVERKPEEIPSYWKIGEHPFVVVSMGSGLHKLFTDKFLKEDHEIQEEKIMDFVVYYKD